MMHMPLRVFFVFSGNQDCVATAQDAHPKLYDGTNFVHGDVFFTMGDDVSEQEKFYAQGELGQGQGGGPELHVMAIRGVSTEVFQQLRCFHCHRTRCTC
jgi:hypothetical protein